MHKEVRILLVEDNEGDIVLTMEALKEAKVHNRVEVARDGDEALRRLRKEGAFKDADTPDLIILDINLPKLDGHELLTIIKNHPVLKIIPVIMLTTSEAERDVLSSYYNHANCYITKPVDIDKFMEVVLAIKNFWISIVQLPKNAD